MTRRYPESAYRGMALAGVIIGGGLIVALLCFGAGFVLAVTR